MSANAQNIAKILLDSQSVRLNVNTPFTFASGIKSPIYCDNRFLLGFPEYRSQVIQAFLSEPSIQEAEVIAGTSTAGIPWATIIADRLNKPLAYVRAEAKAHGVGKVVEGAEVANKKTVIIEDLVSTGKSSKKVLDNLLDSQADIVAIVSIFSYEFKESHTIFGDTPFICLSSFSHLIELAQNSQILTIEQCKLAQQWNIDPHTWGK